MTHNNKEVIGASAFIAHSLWRLTHSPALPSYILPQVAKELEHSYPEAIALVNKGIQGQSLTTEEFAQGLMPAKVYGETTVYPGKACGVAGALPVVVQVVLRGEKGSLLDALVVNALVGGDTAARGMCIAMLLAKNAIPQALLEQIKVYPQIKEKIAQLECIPK